MEPNKHQIEEVRRNSQPENSETTASAKQEPSSLSSHRRIKMKKNYVKSNINNVLASDFHGPLATTVAWKNQCRCFMKSQYDVAFEIVCTAHHFFVHQPVRHLCWQKMKRCKAEFDFETNCIWLGCFGTGHLENKQTEFIFKLYWTENSTVIYWGRLRKCEISLRSSSQQVYTVGVRSVPAVNQLKTATCAWYC